MSQESDATSLQVWAAELQRDYNRSTVLVLLAVLCNALAVAALIFAVVHAPPALALCILLQIAALYLMHQGMQACCRAKGHPNSWATAGLILTLMGMGLWAIVIVALLSDNNKEVREAGVSGSELYKPALYSLIIGFPMPYLGLPIAIHALTKIRSSDNRWRGKGLAIAGIVVSTAMLLLLAAILVTEQRR